MENYAAGLGYAKFYVLIFVIALIFGAFHEMEQKKKKYYLIVTFFIFFYVMAFRNYKIGNDTSSYFDMFTWISRCDSLKEAMARFGYESGYVALNWILSRIYNDPRILFVVTSAFINFSVGRFAYKYADNPGLFCCLFVSLLRFDFFLSAIRHAIAISILLFAFESALKNKKMNYLVLCLLATQFHTSSLVMFLIFPLIFRNDLGRENDKSFYMLLFVVTACGYLFFDALLVRILALFPRYNYYQGSDVFDGEPRLAILLQFLVSFIFLVTPKLLLYEKKEDLREYHITNRLAYINLACWIIASNATALARFSSMFSLYAIILYINSVHGMIKANKRFLLSVTILCSFLYGLIIILLKTPEWQTTYPIVLEFF